MKAILAGLLAFFISIPVMAADNGLWFNPQRNGEGINLLTQDDSCVLFFYTYNDVVTEIPPSVSPAPPPVLPNEGNAPVWYYGQGEDYNGDSCSGTLYYGEGLDYPMADRGDVGEVHIIGVFELLRVENGWLLDVEYAWNFYVPWFVSVYDLHHFPTPLFTD